MRSILVINIKYIKYNVCTFWVQQLIHLMRILLRAYYILSTRETAVNKTKILGSLVA